MQDIYSNSFFLPFFFQLLMWKFLRPPLVFCLFGTLICIMTFLFADIVFDIIQILAFVLVFLGNLNGINFSSWIALLTASMTFIFLKSLSLRLIYISRQRVVILSFVFVFVPIPVFLTGFIFFFFG